MPGIRLRIAPDYASTQALLRECLTDRPEPVRAGTGAGIVSAVAAQLNLTIVYEQGEDGWIIASVPQISGVFSQGRTRNEARENVIDALRLMLSPEPPTGDEREREQLHLTIAA